MSKRINNDIEYTFPKGENLPRNESWLYLLLSDHPFFTEQVKKIRIELEIPKDGLKNTGEVVNWRYSDQEKYELLLTRSRGLLSKFKVPKNLISNSLLFVEDYILNKRLIENLLPYYSEKKGKLKSGKAIRKKSGAGIILADRNREINKYRFTPGHIYIEIYPDTTARDIQSICKMITKKKRKKYSNTIPQPDIIAKEVWDLTKQGKKDNEISPIINDKHKKNLGYENIPVYRKRYKEALKQIKSF